MVMSPGTISWWGAFLSNAVEVHMPIHSDDAHGHDLHVDDEPR
jgi:hypothetical protein